MCLRKREEEGGVGTWGEVGRGVGTLIAATPRSKGSEVISEASRRPRHTGETARKLVISCVGDEVCLTRVWDMEPVDRVPASAAVDTVRTAGIAMGRARCEDAKNSLKSLSVLAVKAGPPPYFKGR